MPLSPVDLVRIYIIPCAVRDKRVHNTPLRRVVSFTTTSTPSRL